MGRPRGCGASPRALQKSRPPWRQDAGVRDGVGKGGWVSRLRDLVTAATRGPTRPQDELIGQYTNSHDTSSLRKASPEKNLEIEGAPRCKRGRIRTVEDLALPHPQRALQHTDSASYTPVPCEPHLDSLWDAMGTVKCAGFRRTCVGGVTRITGAQFGRFQNMHAARRTVVYMGG